MKIIKRLFICVAFFAIQNISAQKKPLGLGGISPMAAPVNPPGDTNTIKFSYDNAGNQVKRYLIYISYGAGKQLNPENEESSDLIANGLKQSEEFSDLSYFPNPVRSELYIKWTNYQNKKLQNIYLIDMNGRELRRFQNITSSESTIIDFVQYPEGTYNLQLEYSNGENKVLKIIRL